MSDWLMIVVFFCTVIAALLAVYVFSPVKRPFLTESDWATHRFPWWQLYYSSKFIAPVKLPARGSGLETLFAADMGTRAPVAGANNDASAMTVTAVGDLMCRRDMQGAAGEHLWDFVGESLFSADLSIGNLEFAVNPEWIIEKLLRYSVAEEVAMPLLGDKRYGRFSMVSLGNNHTNDSLSGGIVSTCNFLERAGVKFTGGNRTAHEQDHIPMFVHNGITVAVLSYTFSTNGVPLDADFGFGINLVRFNALDDDDYDPSLIKRHIAMARAQGADIIIASNHWGVEFEYYPPVRIVRRAHELLEAGVDIIIGHHPHILNPSERYVTRDGRETLVCYSLGSLTTYALPFPIMRLSHLVKINLHAVVGNGKRTVRIGDVCFMPILHSMNNVGGAVVHRLLPVIRTAELMRNGEKTVYLSRKDRASLKLLYREHAARFRQKGFGYS